MCLPGGVLMYIVGMLYHEHGDRPLVTAALKGVAAAAVGLILATAIQLGRKSLSHAYDLIFIALTVIGVNKLHQSVPRVLITVGIIAILWYYPRKQVKEGQPMNQLPALIRVFAYLSLLTVGGGMAAFPELKVLTVEVHHWLTFTQLIHLYSMGQMAPGPNMMMIVSIGEWVAGIPGAVVVVLCVLRSDGPAGFSYRAPVEAAGTVAVAGLDSEGARARLHRPAAGRLLHHGQGRNFWPGNRNYLGSHVDDSARVQDQPGIAGAGWGNYRSLYLRPQIMRLFPKLASAAAIVASFAQVLCAQTLAPRAYVITPEGSNAVTLTWNFYTGDILFDNTLPITGASGSINIFIPTYYHAFGLFGRSANVTASLPYSVGNFQGLIVNQEQNLYRSGVADGFIRLSVKSERRPGDEGSAVYEVETKDTAWRQFAGNGSHRPV